MTLGNTDLSLAAKQCEVQNIFVSSNEFGKTFLLRQMKVQLLHWEKIGLANALDNTYPSMLSSAVTHHLCSSTLQCFACNAEPLELLFIRSVNVSRVTNAELSVFGNTFHTFDSPWKQGWELAWAASPASRCSPFRTCLINGTISACVWAVSKILEQPPQNSLGWLDVEGGFLGLLPRLFF